MNHSNMLGRTHTCQQCHSLFYHCSKSANYITTTHFASSNRHSRTLTYIQWRHQRSKRARSFRGKKSSSQVTRSQGRSQDFLWVYTFPSKKLTTFLVVALKTQAGNAADCFTVKIKKSVIYGNIFIYCSHY